MKAKAMDFSLSSILWTVLLLTWEGMIMAMKNFAETIEKEVPDQWERLGRPKYHLLGSSEGTKSKEYKEFLKPSIYNALNNPKLSRAGLWVQISSKVFFASVLVVLFYYLFHGKS